MDFNNGLMRFLEAQNQTYLKALAEIKNGKKETHWMWYIFPQLKGLGSSSMANYYGIADLEEAKAYLSHPVLGGHLVEISEVLLGLEGRSARSILGTPNDLKLKSCMTLFAHAEGNSIIFQKIIEKYFDGAEDQKTLRRIGRRE